MLASIYDVLGTIAAVLIATGGGKPPDRVPFPRPTTAFQRSAEQKRAAHHDDLVKRLTPV